MARGYGDDASIVNSAVVISAALDYDRPIRSSDERLDVVIVGAGFAGLYMLHKVRELGLSVRLFEAGDGVGGVWYFNRYPGARCDVESVDYSYSFSEELQQEWHWPERYSPQPDILRYINHVADRFDLRRDIQLGTRVTAAVFDEPTERWEIATDAGDQVSARFCIMASGALSVARPAEYPGLDDFPGLVHHTAEWPHEEVAFAGRRVGVIGTGSSGIQVIPVIAEQAEHLYVFQRTPNFTVPAQNPVMDPEYERAVKAVYAERRRVARLTTSGLYRDMSRQSALEVSPDERRRIYEENWRTAGFGFILSFSDLILDKDANDTAVEFINAKIAEQVDDPAVAELLSPRHHPFGTKRPCVAANYYTTFNRDNVTLVDISGSPIERFTPRGVRTAAAEYDLDMIVFATGFDAMTGALLKVDIRGRGGVSLRDKWEAGPPTYLGLATAGFPNLFMITAPGSPSVLSNMMVSIEQHVEWLADLLAHAGRTGIDLIEADATAEDAWVAHVNELAAVTLYPTANSWYLSPKVPGRPRVFMPYPGGLRRYRRRCDAVAENGYEGFSLTPASQVAA
jgi:cation diffusion facilitator CzcD-associated flavoprotein CzcO